MQACFVPSDMDDEAALIVLAQVNKPRKLHPSLPDRPVVSIKNAPMVAMADFEDGPDCVLDLSDDECDGPASTQPNIGRPPRGRFSKIHAPMLERFQSITCMPGSEYSSFEVSLVNLMCVAGVVLHC